MSGDHPSGTPLFFATCPRSTEDLLAHELRALGAPDAAETRAGVTFSGSITLALKACLWSRVASRVLVRLESFLVSGPDDLYEGVRAIAWNDHMQPTSTLAVDVTSAVSRGPLASLNTHYAEQRVKDAIVDQFRDISGTRPSVDLRRPDVRINVHLERDCAVVGIDLAGEALHRRGYRLSGSAAPLKENLAAAVLMRAGWCDLARRGAVLLDPMCGSGTLLIEGAMIAADIAPGLLREYFGFQKWKGADPGDWRPLVADAEERRKTGLALCPPIYGYDADPQTLDAARANLRRAGLTGQVQLQRRLLADLSPPQGRRHRTVEAPQGLVITNPPYGKRLGTAHSLVELYETLGERLRMCFTGWTAAVLTGDPTLGDHLDLRARRSNLFYNGRLPCRLLVFDIDPARFRGVSELESHSTVGCEEGAPEWPVGTTEAQTKVRCGGSDGPAESRAPTSLPNRPETLESPFANRLRKNLAHLRRWAAREGVECFRVYEADIPEYAVAVDLYGTWAHVQEYAAPRTVDQVQARRRLKEILAVTPEVLGIPRDHVVLKVRRPQRGPDQYQKMDAQGTLLEVGEGGLRFLVNLTDYLDTGLFLDHRLTRRLIRELAPGRRFLNLFGYTGTATVYAAAGGATSTTTVDLSATYLDWTRRNLRLNDLTGPEHGFVRADCLTWLAEAGNALSPTGRSPDAHDGYGLIFLDAPTFSNSKRMDGTLDVQRDHAELIRQTVRLLSGEGILLFSTNFRRFKLDPRLAQELQVTDVTRQTIPPDFARNPRIHSCFRITRPGGATPAAS